MQKPCEKICVTGRVTGTMTGGEKICVTGSVTGDVTGTSAAYWPAGSLQTSTHATGAA